MDKWAKSVRENKWVGAAASALVILEVIYPGINTATPVLTGFIGGISQERPIFIGFTWRENVII